MSNDVGQKQNQSNYKDKLSCRQVSFNILNGHRHERSIRKAVAPYLYIFIFVYKFDAIPEVG
jgi:hypothetical protein